MRWVSSALLVSLLLWRAEGATPSNTALAFAGIRTGDRIGVFLPNDAIDERFCEAIGDRGFVYWISLSASRDDKQCGSNSTRVVLQPRARPAQELYNSSDDPGAVYEYYSVRPAIESFITPEPLDVIWVHPTYSELASDRFGSPNLQNILISLYNALKPGGALLILDRANEGSLRMIVGAAGFEFVAVATIENNVAALKFKKR